MFLHRLSFAEERVHYSPAMTNILYGTIFVWSLILLIYKWLNVGQIFPIVECVHLKHNKGRLFVLFVRQGFTCMKINVWKRVLQEWFLMLILSVYWLKFSDVQSLTFNQLVNHQFWTLPPYKKIKLMLTMFITIPNTPMIQSDIYLISRKLPVVED